MIREALGHRRVREWIGADFATALYPSAGRDTRPLTFLHPEVLARRAPGADCPAPEFFVYGDRSPDSLSRFWDARTNITIRWRERLGRRWRVYGLQWESGTYESRRYVIAFFKGENIELGWLAHSEAWLPDVFIGVCDGDAFGGNSPDLCVNRLTRHDLSEDQARAVAVPKWWVTDHFSEANVPADFAVGSYVTSENEFPYRFRGVGRLSREWGGYRNWTALAGTWLFAVEQT